MSIDGLIIDKLEYADDAGLLDLCPQEATARITALQTGFLKEADMVISVPKTKVMHCGRQAAVTVTSDAMERAVEAGRLPYACEYCGERFAQTVDYRHYKHCGRSKVARWKGEYEVKAVLDVRGTLNSRFYKVEWEGDEWRGVDKFTFRFPCSLRYSYTPRSFVQGCHVL